MESDEYTSQQKEATVLDLYKSVTKDWASFFNFIRSLWDVRRREELNQSLAQEVDQAIMVDQNSAVEPLNRPTKTEFPFRAILALSFAFGAQFLVEPPNRFGMMSFALYLAAFGIAIWSYYSDEWRLPSLPVLWQRSDPLTFRFIPLVMAAVFAVLAFVDFGGGLFTTRNMILWFFAIAFICYSLWIRVPKNPEIDHASTAKYKKWVQIGLALTVFGIAVFYRLNQFYEVPNEPFSDHAEKILDVYDVSHGLTKIFFERNTGREAFQMYWTLLVLNIFNTGFTYISLKLGTILLGIFTLPYVYLLGKEYANERVALFALLLFGIAYWPNVISRIGLRFPLYPLFTAPTLYYLIRGLRTQNRNDFILAGIFLGIGLHGYSPFRMVPIFVVMVFGIYFLHARTNEDRRQTVWWLLIVVIISVFVFLPLLRYWIDFPQNFGYRAFTRLGDVETALPGPAWQIFLSNLYKGLLMFNWDDGEIWVHSVVHRPALDMVSAILFAVGVFFVIVRYIRARDWRDLTLLVSIPMLIMPSVLSLAFPGENPSLNRTGGAAVSVILVAAMALDGFLSSFRSEKKRIFIGYALTGIILAYSMYLNYDLVFNQFKSSYRAASWNTSEMGKVLSDFRDKYGQLDTAWIVPFPYWVDTRLPGVWAGVPDRDFAMWRDQLPESLKYPAPKLFMFWNEDPETEKALRELYPDGKLTRYTSAVEGKDFYIFLVEP